jgi:hypothetical protein
MMVLPGVATTALALSLTGCVSPSAASRLGCRAEADSWPFPASWLVGPLDLAEARAVYEDDLGLDLDAAADPIARMHADEWLAVERAANGGAALWLFDAPPDAFGYRGIAAIRSCVVVAQATTLTS